MLITMPFQIHMVNIEGNYSNNEQTDNVYKEGRISWCKLVIFTSYVKPTQNKFQFQLRYGQQDNNI